MSERKPRATKAESLKAKIEKNAAAMAKYQEKLNELAAIDADLKQQLKDLNDEKKKAERALEAKAKREQKKKEEKDLMKAIKGSGLSVDEIKAKLGL